MIRPGDFYVEAQQAISAGNKEQALEKLTASIDAKPNVWAFYGRAKLRAETGDLPGASADCTAGLKLNPEHSDLLWLQGELKKPERLRFKGINEASPGSRK